MCLLNKITAYPRRRNFDAEHRATKFATQVFILDDALAHRFNGFLRGRLNCFFAIWIVGLAC